MAEVTTDQQIEAAVRILKRITRMLFILDVLQNVRSRRLTVQFWITIGQFRSDIRAPGQLANQNLAAIADAFWRHMLVGFRISLNGRYMHAPFVCKR